MLTVVCPRNMERSLLPKEEQLEVKELKREVVPGPYWSDLCSLKYLLEGDWYC